MRNFMLVLPDESLAPLNAESLEAAQNAVREMYDLPKLAVGYIIHAPVAPNGAIAVRVPSGQIDIELVH